MRILRCTSVQRLTQLKNAVVAVQLGLAELTGANRLVMFSTISTPYQWD